MIGKESRSNREKIYHYKKIHKFWAANRPENKFYTLAPRICVSSVRNSLHVFLMAPRILRWVLDFLQFVHTWCTCHFFIVYHRTEHGTQRLEAGQ
jgi:hypothetical protein